MRGMYLRTPRGVCVVSLDAAWASWHLRVACLHLILNWALISHFPSERDGRSYPQREALVAYIYIIHIYDTPQLDSVIC